MLQHFPYRSRWSEVIPALHSPAAHEALRERLADYRRQYPSDYHTAETPPWRYCRSDYWDCYVTDLAHDSGLLDAMHLRFGFDDPEAFDDAVNEDDALGEQYWAAVQEVEAKYEPQPDTIEYYQPFGLCHWMADFYLELARYVEPSLEWKIVRGRHHSTVAGRVPGQHRFSMVFDLMRMGQDPTEVLRDARAK